MLRQTTTAMVVVVVVAVLAVTPTDAAPQQERSGCSERCTRIFTPVCGSDGRTYNNLCLLEFADCKSREQGRPGVTVRHDRPCEGVVPGGTVARARQCVDDCGRVIAPVCGTDGHTYINMCRLRLANCRAKKAGMPRIRLANTGMCGTRDSSTSDAEQAPSSALDPLDVACPDLCLKMLDPVCGSDGVSYNNPCILEAADCRSKAQGQSAIVPISKGRCETAGALTPSVVAPDTGAATSCSQECTRTFLPACGSDGVTYVNDCVLRVADCESRAAGGRGVRSMAQGPCVPPVTEQQQPSQPSPAVGTNEITSGLDPLDIECPDLCLKVLVPVCGSNGVSYNNPCVLEAADCRSKALGGSPIVPISQGRCGEAARPAPPQVPSDPAGASCSKQCTRIFLPLCASDGITYTNKCLMDIASCESQAQGGPAITQVAERPCGVAVDPEESRTSSSGAGDPATDCSRQCTRIFLPLCGSDGKTYNNKCLLDIANCVSRAQGGPTITNQGEGPCGAPETPAIVATPRPTPAPRPPTPRPTPATSGSIPSTCRRRCSDTQRPVCGSDGVTYVNECQLERSSCIGRSTGKTSVYILHNGQCDETDARDSSGSFARCRQGCSTRQQPVCGSDGNTYDNECYLDQINCKNWGTGALGIYIKFDGPCPGDRSPVGANSEVQETVVELRTRTSGTSATLGSHGRPKSQGTSQYSGPADAAAAPSGPVGTCADFCTAEFMPVCGTDGITYSNRCFLNQAICRRRSEGGSALTENFPGPCVAALPRGPVCDQECTRIFLPVCGSDGETYNNECLLQHADCLSPFASITVVSQGPCSGGVAGGFPGASPASSEEDDDSESDEVLTQYLPPRP